MGMLLSQISAVAVFCGFVLIVKGGESIPYMLDNPDFEKVKMRSFEYEPEEYERLVSWIKECLKEQGIMANKPEELKALLLSLFKKTEERNTGKKVLGECVLRFIDEPEIIIKDSGELFRPDIEDDRYSYNVLMSCNRSTIPLL